MAKHTVWERRRHLSVQTEPEEEQDNGLRVVTNRRKRRRFPFLRILFRLILVALVIVVGIYVWQNADDLAPENVIFWVNEKLSGGQGGDGFPVEITGSSVMKLTETQDGLAMLTDTAIVLMNNKGGEYYRRQHGFSNPVMDTAGKWVLVADSGGKRVRLESRASTALEMTINNQITGLAVNRRGDFALVTNSSQGSVSEVVVYNRHQTVIYHWLSDFTILSAALSDSGDAMAVVGVVAENGAMKSVIQLFEFNKTQKVKEYTDTDVMLFSVKYFPNGTLSAVGDTALWVFNQKGTIKQRHSYDDHQLIGYTYGSDAVSVVLRNYGTSEGGSVMTVNPSGDQAYLSTFTGNFRSIASCDSGVLVLTSDHLARFNAVGKQFTGKDIRDGIMVSALNNKSIVLSLTALTELDIPRS